MSEQKQKRESIYGRWGVSPIVNASGTVTRLGGAIMPPTVLQAFCQAAELAVSLEELHAAASREIARRTGAEAGLVTAGSAAALTLGAAAIMCRFDVARMEQLPHCTNFPAEFVIAREQRNGYDHAVRASGAVLVDVGYNEIVANAGVRRTELWEYEAAIGPNTAGVVYVLSPGSQPALTDVVKIAHQFDLPVLVDAAGELPPRNNLRAILATGADLVAFSGGKAIRGPQSTGILCGNRDLIGSAALQMLDMDDHFELWDPPAELIDKRRLAGIPRHGLGRAMKVSKEEIAALLTALERFAEGCYDEELAAYRRVLETIAAEITLPGVRSEILDRKDGESVPRLLITIDPGQVGRSALEVCRALRKGKPPVYVGHALLANQQLLVHPMCLRPEDVSVLAGRLREELSR